MQRRQATPRTRWRSRRIRKLGCPCKPANRSRKKFDKNQNQKNKTDPEQKKYLGIEGAEAGSGIDADVTSILCSMRAVNHRVLSGRLCNFEVVHAAAKIVGGVPILSSCRGNCSLAVGPASGRVGPANIDVSALRSAGGKKDFAENIALVCCARCADCRGVSAVFFGRSCVSFCHGKVVVPDQQNTNRLVHIAIDWGRRRY